ncbi:Uncharacterised protein [Mycobacterium tuberculosis]|nr:Uncharacterised protein [Mycobacterium tuberculosis]
MSNVELPGRSIRPRAWAAVVDTMPGSAIGAKSTKHRPSRNSDAAAIWIARRVLPTPPSPRSVTSR